MTSKWRHRYVSLSNIAKKQKYARHIHFLQDSVFQKIMIRLITGCSAVQIEVLGNITNCLSWAFVVVVTIISWKKCAKICRRRKQDEAIASSCLILATPLSMTDKYTKLWSITAKQSAGIHSSSWGDPPNRVQSLQTWPSYLFIPVNPQSVAGSQK